MGQFLIKELKEGFFYLDESQTKHIIKVLRMKQGERIRLFDGKGKSYLGEIVEIKNNILKGKIIFEEMPEQKKISITLFPSLIKEKRFEIMLEKVTEIGVDRIIPVITERTIIKTENNINNKIKRWKKIIESAGEQSFTEKIPEIEIPVKFTDLFEKYNFKGLSIIAHEKEKDTTLKELILKCPEEVNSVNIFTGPEGGFTDKEIEISKRYGLITFKLGNNILRAETSAIVITAIISLLLNK